MKSLYLYIFSLCFMLPTMGQSSAEIIKAFKSGNVSYITDRLDNSVEITRDGKNSPLSRSDAARFLNDFFSNHKATDFKVIHQSESGGSAFYIGNLTTTQGSFRLTLYLKEKNGKALIQEIRFDR